MKSLLSFIHFLFLGILLTNFGIASPNQENLDENKRESQLITLPPEVWEKYIVPHVKGNDSTTLREISHYFADSVGLSFTINYKGTFDSRKGKIPIVCPVKLTAGLYAVQEFNSTLLIFPNLVSLNVLSNILSTNNGGDLIAFTELKKASSLTELTLDLGLYKFTEENIVSISEIPKLQVLKIGEENSYAKLSSAATKKLPLVDKSLQELTFSFSLDEIYDISDFKTLTKLRKLYLNDLYKTVDFYVPSYSLIVRGLETLKDCSQLEELGLSGLNVNTDTIRLIGKFPPSLKKVILGPVSAFNESEVVLLQKEYPTIDLVLTPVKQ